MGTSIQEVAENIYAFQVPIPCKLRGVNLYLLHDYLLSLEKTRALGFTLGLPSHGPLLTDPQGRIDELLTHHNARLQSMLDSLSAGPQTAYTIARIPFQSVIIPLITG